MIKFVLSKAAGMLAVLSIVAVLVFVLTRAASGDPVSVLLGDQATAEDIERVKKDYGLDKPLPVQFGYWLREVVQGNLGQSIFLQRPVTQALAERILAAEQFFLAITVQQQRTPATRTGITLARTIRINVDRGAGCCFRQHRHAD